MNPSRRRFLSVLLAGGGATLAGGLAGALWATAVEPNWPALERVQVPLAGMPRALSGLKIVHLSDLHISPYTTQADISRAIDLARRQDGDLVVLTGDFIWQDAALAAQLVEPLRGLAAPLGVYAVLGNHDHWHGPGQVADALQAAGIALLENRSLSLLNGEANLWLAGVDDVWEGLNDLELALRGVPSDACTLLLAHEPDFADQAATYPVDLQLSGHSHGGQVRLPGLGPVILPALGRKYPAGLYQVGSMALYTNRGIGLIAPPVRFNCRPEVTVLELVSQAARL